MLEVEPPPHDRRPNARPRLHGRARLNDQLVVALRPLGSRVALVMSDHQYCVALADYWRVMRTVAGTKADAEGG